MRRVYLAETLIDGQLMIDHLRAAGIAAELFHQNALSGLGDLPVTYPEVWIKRDMDLERAIRAVTLFANRPNPSNTKFCDQCGESNPDNFEICWQCLSMLPAVAN